MKKLNEGWKNNLKEGAKRGESGKKILSSFNLLFWGD
jgi:hypothetical protein